MTDQKWRTDTNALDYFGHQKKQLEVADRRPVIRKASDLVGPGIGAGTVRITDYNDLLATFNGYYSSAPGADSAPNATDQFVGYTLSDAEFGGSQTFTSLDTGIEYTRRFERSPVDAEAIAWGVWTGDTHVIAAAQGYTEVDTNVLSSSASYLYAPLINTIGSDTFERTDSTIKVKRQGVYTGSIQIGDRTGDVVLTNLAIYRPDVNTTRGLVQLAVPIAPTVHIPFTVWATDGLQGFSVVVTHAAGSPRDLWWRFSCTRIGDAL